MERRLADSPFTRVSLPRRRHPSALSDAGIDTGDEGDLVVDDADLEYVIESPPESPAPSSKAGAHAGEKVVASDLLGADIAVDGETGAAEGAGLAPSSRPPSAPVSVAESKKSAGGKSSAGSKRRSAGLQQPKTPGAIQVGNSVVCFFFCSIFFSFMLWVCGPHNP